MKITRPIQAIVLGSFLLGVIILLVLILLDATAETSFASYYFLVIPLATTAISFALFSFIFQRYLGERIRTLYRLITNKKFEDQDFVTSINEDVFSQLESDSQEWASGQKEQIQELKEQEEFRREFLGNLAHELKTPVFSIQGYVLTLLEGGLEDESVNREFLERALNGVDRISAILEDLDEISKYEFDRYSLKLSEFDVVEFTKKIFGELEKKGEEKGVKFEFSENYDAIMVRGDMGKLSQVMTNLISNSISYSSDEGITTVRFHTLDRGTLLVEVADNGLGINEKHLPRLFERFYRVDKSRARNIGGSGLGLAIVKHIVEAHGQSIKVRSTEGVGSTFSFTLEKVV
ncbi:MAG: hypothetical protein BM555_01910 [Crocinitomix sp. MedPE-SWsnd]|jgi:two-component system, OmpR family, phosphate regulon sensor histidine kinase PhoR|nr:MAG: hypothetical protein BM555_01910 [Crocinitomix sp. MedPE-SWsnd]